MTMTVSSGKGGVGKTLSVVNLAYFIQKIGYRVLIIDGDLGMANVDVVLGLRPRYNMRDVLDGNATWSEIMLEGPEGIKILPSGSGISKLQDFSYVEKQSLLSHIEDLKQSFDFYLIDTGAGIGSHVIHFNKLSQRRLVVTTPEPHAITDAYALIKVLNQNGIQSCDLIVNMVHKESQGDLVAQRIINAANSFMKIDIRYLGSIPVDPSLARHVMRRDVCSEECSKTVSAQSWAKVARKILNDSETRKPSREVSKMNFFSHYLNGI